MTEIKLFNTAQKLIKQNKKAEALSFIQSNKDVMFLSLLEQIGETNLINEILEEEIDFQENFMLRS
jgi:hypothetical protein